MRRKLFQVIAISAAAMFLFAACGNPAGSDESKNKNKVTDGEYGAWEFDPTLTEEYKPEDTNVVLAENGETEYVIVVPENTPWQVSQARQELNLFFGQSTGVQMPVVSDTGLTFDTTKKYVSIGNTTVYQGSGMNLTYDEYEEDGFAIKTFGNTVIVCFMASMISCVII